MTLRKKRMLMFNFKDNEINELTIEQQHDQFDETPIEPPFTGVDETGRMYTQQRSLKNKDLSDNPTTGR